MTAFFICLSYALICTNVILYMFDINSGLMRSHADDTKNNAKIAKLSGFLCLICTMVSAFYLRDVVNKLLGKSTSDTWEQLFGRADEVTIGVLALFCSIDFLLILFYTLKVTSLVPISQRDKAISWLSLICVDLVALVGVCLIAHVHSFFPNVDPNIQKTLDANKVNLAKESFTGGAIAIQLVFSQGVFGGIKTLLLYKHR